MCLPLAGATLTTAGVENQITARSLPHTNVMAGLVPAIHVFNLKAEMKKDVDARAKRGHDGQRRFNLIGTMM
jgi:hypothetical protein